VRISQLRRESFNDLIALARDDADFMGVSPNLFGPKTLMTTSLPDEQQPGSDLQNHQKNKRPFFEKATRRGSAREGAEDALTTTCSKGTMRQYH
jgi:hypothetical protein